MTRWMKSPMHPAKFSVVGALAKATDSKAFGGARSILVARMANLEAGGPRLGDRQVVMELGGERSDVASVARGHVVGTDVGYMVRHVAAK